MLLLLSLGLPTRKRPYTESLPASPLCETVGTVSGRGKHLVTMVTLGRYASTKAVERPLTSEHIKGSWPGREAEKEPPQQR